LTSGFRWALRLLPAARGGRLPFLRHRTGGGEGVDDMMRKFPWYFVPRFTEFGSQVQKLPFEAYWYIALAAPRPWIDAEGTTDTLNLPVRYGNLCSPRGRSMTSSVQAPTVWP